MREPHPSHRRRHASLGRWSPAGTARSVESLARRAGSPALLGPVAAEPAALEALEARQLLATAFAVTSENVLLQFETANPSVIVRATPITGMPAGERIATLDLKPGTGGNIGAIYAIASGTRTPIYTIDPVTGVATRFANGLAGGFPLEYAVGFDYDDLNNVFRYVDELSGTYRFDGDTGIYIRNDAGVIGLTDVAYRPTGGDAGLFQMVGVISTSDEFAVINPTTGAIISSGPLGVDVDKWVGLDMLADGSVFMTARIGGVTRLGAIASDGHSFVDLGVIGDGSHTIRGLTLDPSAPAAPTLNAALSPRVNTISEDDVGNLGTPITSLIHITGGDLITDPNLAPLEGVAITAVNTAHGLWQYSLDGGGIWNDVGSVSETSALLLPAISSARIRLVPGANFHGSIAQAVRFRAWDQTAHAPGDRVNPGIGGGSGAFSTAGIWAPIDVLPVRDAPTILGGAGGGVISITEKQTAAPFAAFTIQYIDSATTPLTLTVTFDIARGSFTADSVTAAGFAVSISGSLTFTGNAADVTTAIRQLIFKPRENIAPVGQTTLSILTLTVDDGFGQSAQAFSPFIGSLSIRDDATISGLLDDVIDIDDRQTVTPLVHIEFGYADDASRALTVDVLLGSDLARFTPESLAASGFAALDDTTYRFTGTAAAATEAARRLVLMPVENAAPGGSIWQVTIGVSVNDGLGPATSAAGPTVQVLSVNDRPTTSGFVPLSQIRINKSIKPFRRVVVADADAGEQLTAVVTINKPAKGTFRPASLARSGFVQISRAKFQFTGTAEEVQDAVRKLVFKYKSTLRPLAHQVKFKLRIADESGAFVMNQQTKLRLRV